MKQATLHRTRGIALDMGTESTRLLAPGSRLSQTPTRDPLTGKPVVVHGLIVDAEGAGRLAARLIARRKSASRVVAACPLHVASARPRLAKALRLAGVRKVEFVGSMVAAAAGAGVDVTSPYAEMVVDVGAGLTEVAVFRNAGVLAGGTIPMGTRDLRFAERDLDPEADRSPRGLARHVFRMWRELPIDAQVEVIENGLVLTGGGAAIPEVVDAMQAETRLSVRAAPDPAQAVIRGLARLALGAR
jgi:rod shape-determining protein MreB